MTERCRVRLGIHGLAPRFFCHSAILSLPAVLLRKLSNSPNVTATKVNVDNPIHSLQVCLLKLNSYRTKKGSATGDKCTDSPKLKLKSCSH